jgi:hypothetical protein
MTFLKTSKIKKSESYRFRTHGNSPLGRVILHQISLQLGGGVILTVSHC